MDFAALARHTDRITRLYRRLCFGPILPASSPLPNGPAVVLAAHYNGLLDGFVYCTLSPRLLAVLSTQWHGSALGRFLLPGVGVVRSKDQDKGASATSNTAAFKSMQMILQAGHPLLFFPEGTSRLGPERLPVQRGTALLLKLAQSVAPEIPVYFTAAHYENPTRWRSRAALALDGPHSLPAEREDWLNWVAAGLQRAQSQAMSRALPARPAWRPALRRALGALALLPVLPACISAHYAIRRCADDSNVISLWRMLGGVPAVLVCWLLWAIIALVCGTPVLALAVPLLTLLGVALWEN